MEYSIPITTPRIIATRTQRAKNRSMKERPKRTLLGPLFDQQHFYFNVYFSFGVFYVRPGEALCVLPLALGPFSSSISFSMRACTFEEGVVVESTCCGELGAMSRAERRDRAKGEGMTSLAGGQRE